MNKCIKGESCLHCDTDYCRFKDEVAELKAENERLKNEHLVKSYEYNYSKQLINTYKQALQEIRDIAKEQLQDVSDRCINTTPMYIVQKDILTKINEVIGAE